METIAGIKHYTQLWRSPRAKSLASCYVHLPSLITTITLIYINFSSTWFSSVGSLNQNARFNALQFAAKIHEIVIVASLSVVAISCVQHELCRRQGLALGGILAAFQITNILSLFSPALWKRCLTKGNTSYGIQFGLLVMLITILSAIVGPSSAILMQPSVGTWNLPFSIQWIQDNTIKDMKIFLAGDEFTIWPAEITTSNFLPPECVFTNASTPLKAHCAAAGLPIFFTKPWQGSFSGDEYGLNEGIWNFTMSGEVSFALAGGPSRSYPYKRAVRGIVDQSERIAMVTQSTLSSIHNAMITLFVKASSATSRRREEEWTDNVSWRFSLSNGSRTFAPQTFVICNTEPLLLDSATGTVLAGQNLVFPLRGSTTWSMDSSPLTNRWNSTTQVISMWAEPPDLYNNTPSISFALIGQTGQERRYLNHTSASSYTITAPEIVTCSVFASWHPVDMTLRSGTPFRISSSAIDNGPEYYKVQRPFDIFSFMDWAEFNITEPGIRDIRLHTSWADLALPPALTVEQIVSTLGQHSLEPRGWLTRTALSFLVTDALSRLDSSTEVLIAGQVPLGTNERILKFLPIRDISSLNMSNVTEIKITRDRYGYSYSTSGKTRELAIGVMLVHIAIALIHTALVLWYGWWCPGLRSLSDFFVLAVESSNPEPPEDTSQLEFTAEKHKCIIQVHEIGDEKLEMKIYNRS